MVGRSHTEAVTVLYEHDGESCQRKWELSSCSVVLSVARILSISHISFGGVEN